MASKAYKKSKEDGVIGRSDQPKHKQLTVKLTQPSPLFEHGHGCKHEMVRYSHG